MPLSTNHNIKLHLAAIAGWLLVAGFEGALLEPILLLPSIFFVFTIFMAMSGYLNRPLWLGSAYAFSIIILVLLWLLFREQLGKQSALSLVQFLAIPAYTFAGLILVKVTWQCFHQ